MENLNNKTKKELVEIAKSLGIKGYSNKNKVPLIRLIEQSTNNSNNDVKESAVLNINNSQKLAEHSQSKNPNTKKKYFSLDRILQFVPVGILFFGILTFFGVSGKKSANKHELKRTDIHKPAFSSLSENELQVLLMPFNFISECKEYNTDYELAFYQRLKNLSKRYKIPINVKLYNCNKHFSFEKLNEMSKEYPMIEDYDKLLKYDIASSNNAHLLVYGRYSNYPSGNGEINLDYIYSNKKEFQNYYGNQYRLKYNLNVDKEKFVEMFDHATRILYPEKTYQDKFQFNLESNFWIKESQKEDEFVKFDKAIDLENPDLKFEIDVIIAKSFINFYVSNGQLSKANAIYNDLYSHFKLKEDRYKLRKKFSNLSADYFCDLFFDDEDTKIIKDFEEINFSFDDVTIDKYNYFFTALVSAYLSQKKYKMAHEIINYLRKREDESLNHHLTYVVNLLSISDKITRFEYPGIKTIIQESTNKYGSTERFLDEYNTYLKSHNISTNSYEIFPDGNYWYGCDGSYNCIMINYFENKSLYTLINYQDKQNRLEGIREYYCKKNYSLALLHYLELNEKFLIDEVMIATLFYNFNDKINAKKHCLKVQNSDITTSSIRLVIDEMKRNNYLARNEKIIMTRENIVDFDGICNKKTMRKVNRGLGFKN